jgi:hypothetical protein
MALTWSAAIKPIFGAYGETLFSGNTDDSFVYAGELKYPFPVNGINYTSIYVGSNTYVTFGAGSSVFPANPTNLTIPAIIMGTGDNSYQLVTKFRLGDADVIHFEGANARSGTPGAPTMLIEWYFWDSGRAQVIIGQHNMLSGWGVSAAGNWLATIPPVQNTSYTLQTTDSGVTWTILEGSWVDDTPTFVPTSGAMGVQTQLLTVSYPSPATRNLQQILQNSRPAPYQGYYKISGTTKRANGEPYSAHVMVYPNNAPGLCVASARTDAVSGAFNIEYLAYGTYTLVAVDPTGTYNDLVYDQATAVPM